MSPTAKNKGVEMLPDDTDNNSVDVADLRVNFSTEEASSEALDFTPMPTGKYHVALTKLEVKACGPESKNPGKPYWNVQLTVQNGPYENRKLFANLMLFEGALYSTAQLLKATGHGDALESGKIPDGQTLVGEEFIVTVVKQKDTYRMKQDPDGEVVYKNEVKGYKPLAGDSTGVGSSSGGSLLP